MKNQISVKIAKVTITNSENTGDTSLKKNLSL